MIWGGWEVHTPNLLLFLAILCFSISLASPVFLREGVLILVRSAHGTFYVLGT